MRKAREYAAKMLGKKEPEDEKDEFDEDEKEVSKHLSRDIEESKKSIKDDKKLKRSLMD